MLLSDSALDTETAGHHTAGSRHLIRCKANVSLVSAEKIDVDVIGLRHLHDLLHDLFRLLASHDRAGGHHRLIWRDQPLGLAPVHHAAHAFLPVLITLMFLNLLGTHPWLTAFDWPGCPLP